MSEGTERESLRRRVEILEAQLLAAEHAVDMANLLVEADNPEDAARTIQRTYDMTDLQAASVLDLQFRRLTTLMREMLRQELEQLRIRLATDGT